MSKLQVCQACQRHIRLSESACPFCAEKVSRQPGLGPARSALLATALAGASALGCSDERPATKAPPPVPEATPVVVIDAAMPDPMDAAVVADAASPDAGVADAATKKRKKRKKPAALKPKEPTAAETLPDYSGRTEMPYGAPPSRRRIV